MTSNKREIINELLIFIVGLIIAVAAIITDDGSVDDMAVWETGENDVLEQN